MSSLQIYSYKKYWSFLLILNIIFTTDTFALLIDYTENTELIQQRAGFDIKLQCGLKGLVDDNKISDVKIHWYFKHCSEDISSTSTTNTNCHDFHDDNWTQIPCEGSFCQQDLLLRNVTEKYSGLYKCIVIPYETSNLGPVLDIQFVRTYQLDIKNTTSDVPEFMDSYPLNKTALIGSQVVFQCRVHSEVRPTIKWFRRIPLNEVTPDYGNGVDNFNAHYIKYNGRTYELLSSAREKLIDNDIYLSKLILNNVNIQHNGFYACVAISFQGHKIREAYLQINANDVNEAEYWSDYSDKAKESHTDPKEFWLLFLMPLGLAMLPITVWLGYIFYKRYKQEPISHRMRQFTDEEIEADHLML